MNNQLLIMSNKVVTPRFSEDELRKIDSLIGQGIGRCRSDFVRTATVYYIERENSKPDYTR